MTNRSPRDILAAWRELERRQAEIDPQDESFDALELDIARLRSEYHRVTALHIALADQLRAASRESMRRVGASALLREQSRAILRARPRRMDSRESD